MRKPKLRELKEAVVSVFTGPFTLNYPKEEPEIPELFRGKPEYQEDGCIGCMACAQVCPPSAISVVDDTEATPPVRRLVVDFGRCIFCGECQRKCPTQEGITLTHKYDLGTFAAEEFSDTESVEKELVLCEVCGEVISTKEHLVWIADKLGAKKYANPTLVLLSETIDIEVAREKGRRYSDNFVDRSDNVRILCPECRRSVITREILG